MGWGKVNKRAKKLDLADELQWTPCVAAATKKIKPIQL